MQALRYAVARVAPPSFVMPNIGDIMQDTGLRVMQRLGLAVYPTGTTKTVVLACTECGALIFGLSPWACGGCRAFLFKIFPAGDAPCESRVPWPGSTTWEIIRDSKEPEQQLEEVQKMHLGFPKLVPQVEQVPHKCSPRDSRIELLHQES